MATESMFYKLYMTSRKSISRVVARIVPPDEIEDIVQETYVRICQVENKDSIQSLKSFMFKTAKNLALDYQKQANVRLIDHIEDAAMLEQLLSDKSCDEMYEKAVTNSEFAHLCEAVRQLPVQCRKVFVLKKVYGYSQREIAEQIGISESTVEKHIAAGVKRCTLYMRKTNTSPTGVKQNTAIAKTMVGGSYE